MNYSTIGKRIKEKAGIAALVWLVVALLSAVSVNVMSGQVEEKAETKKEIAIPGVVKHRLEVQGSVASADVAQ